MWLPGAMAAPTPVSAYLHSATMVKAGVYLVARFAPAFAFLPVWRPTVVAIGVATMLWGGVRALRQHDLKLLLAFGTISQLGFLTTMLGVGTPESTLAGAALLLAHGAFKATLFMVTGVIDAQTGTRDLRLLSGVGRRMPLLFAVAAVAAASMAGLPPLLGFIAKEAAFEAFLHGGLGPTGPAALVGVALGSVLTVAYSVRFVTGAFATKAGAGPDAPGAAFVAPAALLAVFTAVAGLAPVLVSPLVLAAAAALDPAVEAKPLALWHGINTALGLSVLAVVAGWLLGRAGTSTDALAARYGGWPGGDAAYAGSVRGLNVTADRVTGVVQNGSLPVYLGVILLTVVALPLPPLLGALDAPRSALAESPLQVIVCAGTLAAAVSTVLARRRFTAVLCLGGVGYAVAVLFVLQGAPDLALAQLLIETLAVVIFVMVLRHLPDDFQPQRWRLGQGARVLVAGAVGVFVFVFALIAGAARTAPPISREFLTRALPEGEGRNVVNVILVDFRGFDTLGEITVLAVAALGIAGLVRSVRLDRDAGAVVDEPGAAVRTGDPEGPATVPAQTRPDSGSRP
jgi:multicomponent Na+:H+ antiporter subunit A